MKWLILATLTVLSIMAWPFLFLLIPAAVMVFNERMERRPWE